MSYLFKIKMVNQTIVQGLMQAVSRGESLHQAMMSFFNAGYAKQEIEEAAAEVQRLQSGKPAPKYKKAVADASKKVAKSVPAKVKPAQKPASKVSSYGAPEGKVVGKVSIKKKGFFSRMFSKKEKEKIVSKIPIKKDDKKIEREKVDVSKSKVKKLPGVSNYSPKKKGVSWWLIILLGLFLLGLVGVLIFMLL